MLHGTKFISVLAGVLITAVAMAQATPPVGAPAGATGLCKDGTYWTGATKRGACHGHKGVQDWYAATDSSGAATAPAAAPAATAAPAAAPAPAMAMKPAPTPAAAAPAATTTAPAPAAKGGPAPTQAQAPGGGPGLVWVNSSSKVYHCSTDRWYGKTKSGEYMSEADALAKGNHADHGKSCSK
jgi:hypothetical protein